VALGLAVLIVSSAAILIRIAQREGVSSMAIASWRLAFAALALAPLVLTRYRAELQQVPRQDFFLGGVAGVFLALHFASWISSLAYTSVASSTALVTTNPVWIALVSWLVFGERLGKWLMIGIAAAIAGSALIFLSDATQATTSSNQNALIGNLLSVAGSMTVCGYLLLGRRLRRSVPLMPYVWVVYSCAAIVLLLTTVLAGLPLTGFSFTGWLCLAGLAIGPQLLGHTIFNWALKHVSATFIAIAILGEPIGSALLAWLIFGETFAFLQMAGFALLMAGIYLASRQELGPSTST
jgi:drug/metabolite transporter (DMT)-like permease